MREEIIYANAPIIEAVFELKFKTQCEFNAEEFDRFYQLIKEDFPTRKDVNTQVLGFTIGSKVGQAPVAREMKGQRYFSSDSKDVLHLTCDSFAYSRLTPYTKWQDALPRFLSNYEKLLKITPKIHPARLGLRYINKWSFLADEIDEYLKIKPAFDNGDELFMVSQSLMTFKVVHPTTGAKGDVRLQLKPKSSSQGVMLEASFDIFVNNDVQTKDAIDFEAAFLKLRNLKNDIFEANINDKSREVFHDNNHMG